MVGPVTARILASLGLSLVAMTGLTVAVTELLQLVTDSLTGLPNDALLLGGLLGLWDCLGIALGGVSFVATWHGTAGVWKMVKA